MSRHHPRHYEFTPGVDTFDTHPATGDILPVRTFQITLNGIPIGSCHIHLRPTRRGLAINIQPVIYHVGED